jgi:four helix bundle protein
MNRKSTFDLQERLIDFAVLVIQVTNEMPGNQAGKILADQLLRSGTSPALHYGEAQGAESKRDFIHKLKVGLKELRESHACLRIIQKAKLHKDANNLESCRKECSELVAIFQASVNTAEGNRK